MALVVLLAMAGAHANSVDYVGASEECVFSVAKEQLVSTPWRCGVQQSGTLSVDSCTATSCKIIAAASATGSSAAPEQVGAQFTPTVSALIALNSDEASKVICSATGTQGTSATQCSDQITYTLRRSSAEYPTLFCVFAEYHFGLDRAMISQRMWLDPGPTPGISEVFGSGC